MATPTRLIIVLDRRYATIQYALRADVPVGQEPVFATPAATSPTGNAADPDLPGLIAGTIAQVIQSITIPQPPGEPFADYRARVQAELVAQQAAFQARVATSAPHVFFGAYYNGATWAPSGG